MLGSGRQRHVEFVAVRLEAVSVDVDENRVRDGARHALPERVEFVYLLPQGEPAIDRASFDSSAWQGPSGPLLSRAVQTLLNGIREGRHFIVPDETHCSHCDYSALCRRTHQPTWWRAYRAAAAKELREIRSQKVARD